MLPCSVCHTYLTGNSGLGVAVWPAFAVIYPTLERASNVRSNQYRQVLLSGLIVVLMLISVVVMVHLLQPYGSDTSSSNYPQSSSSRSSSQSSLPPLPRNLTALAISSSASSCTVSRRRCTAICLLFSLTVLSPLGLWSPGPT